MPPRFGLEEFLSQESAHKKRFQKNDFSWVTPPLPGQLVERVLRIVRATLGLAERTYSALPPDSCDAVLHHNTISCLGAA